MPFGAPGGDAQVQAMLQVFLNIVEFRMDPQEAVEVPRFSTFNFPNSFFPHTYHAGLLMLEKGIEETVSMGLKNKGYRAKWWPERAWRAGGVCAIVVDSVNGILLGAADPRVESYALGW